jgi:hypothetical protein
VLLFQSWEQFAIGGQIEGEEHATSGALVVEEVVSILSDREESAVELAFVKPFRGRAVDDEFEVCATGSFRLSVEGRRYRRLRSATLSPNPKGFGTSAGDGPYVLVSPPPHCDGPRIEAHDRVLRSSDAEVHAAMRRRAPIY